ncbi:MAG: DUF1588 domain-containing protein [Gammaproteobacteria bacterium]|nr:DUF1588 domain-containing protein [Gammaproteobacteria bacterium]
MKAAITISLKYLALLVCLLSGVASAEETFTLDVDGDGAQEPLTDGLLVIRHLFSFTDQALILGAVNEAGTRTDALDISAYLEANEAALDIDANGDVDPLTDGLMVIRYLFGFTSTTLTQSAVAGDANRISSEAIEAYLASISVGNSGGGGTAASSYFEDAVSDVILNNCIVCHNASGPASSTPLIYLSSSDESYLASNYETLRSYIAGGGGDTLLSRARGVSHGGGAVLNSSDEAYGILQEFVLKVESESGLGNGEEPGGESPSAYFESTKLLAARETLRRATILLIGRNPTLDETALLDGEDESGLRAALSQVTRDQAFPQFLARAANDRLLTDAFIDGTPIEQSNINGNGFYPLGSNAQAEIQAQGSEGSFYWQHKWDHWAWGLARAPVELIAYIVDNDRDYREVVTADYMMMNYAVNDFLAGGASFDPGDPALLPYCNEMPSEPCIDYRIFKPGYHRGQTVLDDQLEFEDTASQGRQIVAHSGFIEYPHAGVLNTQAFLNRYPSTETNRNRARARWTFYHFLGVDIEKSAPRATDPVALADTNNPTLKNPACTVCHQVLDPVAGAFEHYGDVGYYNESWEGLDALPYNYKQEQPDPASSDTFVAGNAFNVENESYGPNYTLEAELTVGTVYYRVSFNNDYSDEDGDRNARFLSLTVTGPSNQETIEFESLPEGTTTAGCGGPQSDGYWQYCPGGVLIPISINEAGTYLFELQAAGEQYGDEPVHLVVSLDTDAEGADRYRYHEGDTWYRDMRDPGFLGLSAPDQVPSLAWLTEQMVADPWFAEAAVKFWWPALMGQEVASAPEVLEDADFEEKLALFEAQNLLITNLAESFANGINGGSAFNGRDLIVELMLTPWFRVDSAVDSNAPASVLGTRRLLTPEELEAKFFHLAGFYWGNWKDEFSVWTFGARYTKLSDEFKILYGGIDSRNVTRRPEQMSAIMFNIAERMALESTCEIVIRDFDLPNDQRRLFNETEILTTPERRFLDSASASMSNTDFEAVLELPVALDSGDYLISLAFTNSYGDNQGHRAAQFDRLSIIQPDGSTLTIELESPPQGTNFEGCSGQATAEYQQLNSNCTMNVPLNLTQTGNHSLTLLAAGQQYGDEPVEISLGLLAALDNQDEIRFQLAILHQKLLGETLSLDDPEINASYSLLTETLDYRRSLGGKNVDQWPLSSCDNHLWGISPLDTTDLNGMKATWVTVLTYLMTDFRFLHE